MGALSGAAGHPRSGQQLQVFAEQTPVREVQFTVLSRPRVPQVQSRKLCLHLVLRNLVLLLYMLIHSRFQRLLHRSLGKVELSIASPAHQRTLAFDREPSAPKDAGASSKHKGLGLDSRTEPLVERAALWYHLLNHSDLYVPEASDSECKQLTTSTFLKLLTTRSCRPRWGGRELFVSPQPGGGGSALTGRDPRLRRLSLVILKH